jgi:hypothetical protein
MAKQAKPTGTTTLRCRECSVEAEAKVGRKGALCPRGWHNVPEKEASAHAGFWCADCWKETFVPRSITIPIAGPDQSSGSWEDLRKSLRQCWDWSTAVANWLTTELARLDTPRSVEATKLGAAPKFYEYPHVKDVAPGMDSQAIIAVTNTVKRNYNEKRFDVLWSRTAAFPCYDWPYPYAIDADGWKPIQDPTDKRPAVRVRLAGQVWILRLAGGLRNRRKIDGWKKVFSGQAIKRECAILAKTVTKSDHRNGTTSKANSGGRRRVERVMIKISAWFPRKEANYAPADEPRTMVLKTSGDSFLSYRIGDTGEWRSIHADHIRRMRNQHFARSTRFAQDKKYERRWPKRVLRQMLERQEDQCRKFNDRMNSWLHEVTKIVAEYACRRKITHVVIDLRNRSFGGDRFPWFKLRSLIEYKLHERRIAYEYVDDIESVGEPKADATPEVQTVRRPRKPRAAAQAGAKLPHRDNGS